MSEVLCFESWAFVSIKPFSVGSVSVNQDPNVELLKPINVTQRAMDQNKGLRGFRLLAFYMNTIQVNAVLIKMKQCVSGSSTLRGLIRKYKPAFTFILASGLLNLAYFYWF